MPVGTGEPMVVGSAELASMAATSGSVPGGSWFSATARGAMLCCPDSATADVSTEGSPADWGGTADDGIPTALSGAVEDLVSTKGSCVTWEPR